ncbi:hypothetical protein [Nocardia asteroides]|uniref:hypothetical protein n=1 Tax=Nocardia asteroides TaxID=1824 RepID=UPI001E5927C5|nr:hypothetical protein [Nocardia asteroides]UGT61705.1 hypothetical protein LTT61_32145 [Nocardia asteroides]
MTGARYDPRWRRGRWSGRGGGAVRRALLGLLAEVPRPLLAGHAAVSALASVGGRAAEYGTHDQLIAREGRYRRLYEQQREAYE